MLNRIITGAGAVVSGALLAFGPCYIFPLCAAAADGGWMKCHWTGQAVLGVGFMIGLLGILLFMASSVQTRLGLSAAIVIAAVFAFLLPSALIGGCGMETMACRRISFPAITVISLLTAVGFAVNALYLLAHSRRSVGI
ncbi:MAG: DUF4418 family protein [Clostridiales Family XIII bacterium]|jgi:hypothetical protein|nr:DUF4418 family protein [Clostridiales Family XIII bacterium]